MPREAAVWLAGKKINLYDYAPKKTFIRFFENGQIQAVRMTEAESDFAPLIIVGNSFSFHFSLAQFSLAFFHPISLHVPITKQTFSCVKKRQWNASGSRDKLGS